MSVLVIQHPIRDFQAWRKAVDGDPAARSKRWRLTTRPLVVRLAGPPSEHGHSVGRPESVRTDPPTINCAVLGVRSRESMR